MAPVGSKFFGCRRSPQRQNPWQPQAITFGLVGLVPKVHGRCAQVERGIAHAGQASRRKHGSELVDRYEVMSRTLKVVIGLIVVRHHTAHQGHQVTEVDLPTGVNHRIRRLRRFQTDDLTAGLDHAGHFP